MRPLRPDLLAILLLGLVSVPLGAGIVPSTKEAGPQPGKTWTKGDPISMGGAEFRQGWRLFNLGGPMDLGFSLIYAPDLVVKTPFNEGRFQFPPPWGIAAFTSDAILRVVIFEDRSQEPYRSYANVFLADDTLVFEKDASGAYRPHGNQPFELKAQGDFFCLKDPYQQRVLFFRSRQVDVDWNPFWIGRVGEVQEIRDRNGNALTYTYNADNVPTRIEDGLGRRLEFAYRESPSMPERDLISVTDHAGRTVSFRYGTCGTGTIRRLESFTDPEGRATAFVYQGSRAPECYKVSKILRPEGNSHIDQDWGSTFIPSLTRQRDAYGNETSLSLSTDPQGVSTVTATEPGGAETTFRHQDSRHPLSLTDPAGRTLQVGYDGFWRPASLTDREGGTATFAYDLLSGFPAVTTDAAGHTWTATYEARDQSFTLPASREEVTFTFHLPTCIAGPSGPCEQIAYDARGNALSRTDGAGRTSTATHDAGGRVLTETNPGGGVTTFTYHPDGSLATRDDSDTEPAGFEYDSRGYLTRVAYPDGSSLQLARDLAGRVTSFTDEASRAWTFQYDPNGNLDRATDPAQASTLFEHDLMDRTRQVTDRTGGAWARVFDARGFLASVSDPADLAASFGYDSRGRMEGLTSGGASWTFAHDDEGVLTSWTSPLGLTTAYATDALGHPLSVTLPDGRTTTFARDGWGRVTSVTDPQGRTWGYTYDPTGLLKTATLPDGSGASFSHDLTGSLEALVGPMGDEWLFGRTPMGRLASLTDPLGRAWTYAFDGRGLRSAEGYPGGESLAIARDASGRVLQRTCSSGPDLHYAYDPAGRLASTEGIALQRDAEGRITGDDDGQVALGATYDAAGRLASLSYGGLTVEYAYDSATGLPASVGDSHTGTTVTFTWDADGRLTGIQRPGGHDTTLTWDAASRIARIRHGDLVDIAYSRDAAGQVTSVTTLGGLDGAAHLAASSRTFAYDAASQPTGAGFATDPRGRTTLLDGRALAWDGASRLLAAGGTTYFYNGASQAVRRTESRSDRRLQYHHALPGAPLAIERDAASGNPRYYIYDSLGNLLYGIDPAAGERPFHFYFDAQGSTLLLTGAGGQVTDAYAYDPYGALLAHQGSSDQPFTFNGRRGVRREDAEGRLYRMGLRLYDAATARFLSKEPLWPHLREPRSLNPYQFAFGNPLTFADPAGTDPGDPAAAYFGNSSPPLIVERPMYFNYGAGQTGAGPSASAESSEPLIVERPMYFQYREGSIQWVAEGSGEAPLGSTGGPSGSSGFALPANDMDAILAVAYTNYYRSQSGQRPSRAVFRYIGEGTTRPGFESWVAVSRDAEAQKPVRTTLFYLERNLQDRPSQRSARQAPQKVKGVWIWNSAGGGGSFIPGGQVSIVGQMLVPGTSQPIPVQEVWDPRTQTWRVLNYQRHGEFAVEGLGPAEIAVPVTDASAFATCP